MITVAGSVETKLSAEKAFVPDEFENTSKWDPGTPVMDKITPGPWPWDISTTPSRLEFRGKRQSLIYEVIELTGSHIKLRGRTRPSSPSIPSTSPPMAPDPW